MKNKTLEKKEKQAKKEENKVKDKTLKKEAKQAEKRKNEKEDDKKSLRKSTLSLNRLFNKKVNQFINMETCIKYITGGKNHLILYILYFRTRKKKRNKKQSHSREVHFVNLETTLLNIR